MVMEAVAIRADRDDARRRAEAEEEAKRKEWKKNKSELEHLR